MAAPVKLRIILGENNSQRLVLPGGLPESVHELTQEIKKQCNADGDFRLQFMDPDFGNEFNNLTSISDVQDKGTIKVVFSSVSSTVPPPSPPPPFLPSSTSGSDTDIVSSPESTTSSRSSGWPVEFHVPQFAYDAELQLSRANAEFKEKGTVLDPNPKLRSSILDGLTEAIVQFKVYLSDDEFVDVAQALVTAHPCLKDPGSPTGFDIWKQSLKYKLSNYRRKLGVLGCPEVTVNSLKNKPKDKCSPAYRVKRPKKAEVNYCPPYAAGESAESMEVMRVALLSEVKKRNNEDTISKMMDMTFAHRTQEVVQDEPLIVDFKTRWPGLFSVRESDDERAKDFSQIMFGIVVIRHACAEAGDHEYVGIVLEGVEVLGELRTIPFAVAMLLGLVYALNLSYPAELKYTFEALQKIFMELDSNKMSLKIRVLKTKLSR